MCACTTVQSINTGIPYVCHAAMGATIAVANTSVATVTTYFVKTVPCMRLALSQMGVLRMPHLMRMACVSAICQRFIFQRTGCVDNVLIIVLAV